MTYRHAAVLSSAVFCAATFAVDAAAAPAAARGEYLVNFAGCADCHTPMTTGPKGPMPDVTRGLSGHPQAVALPPPPAPQGPWLWGGAATNTAFWGPWGTSYATNLTPDVQTGIGAWKADDFVRAMRTGKHLGTGRPILPPMPWQGLGRLDEADLRAIFAYLMSRPAVANLVPQAAVAPPPKP